MTFTPGSSQPLPSGPYDPTPIDYTGVPAPPDRPRPAGVSPTYAPTTGQEQVQPHQATTMGVPTAPKPVFWTYDQAQKAGGMEPTFEGKVNKLLALAKSQGVVLWLGSGFRDNVKQTALYKQGIADHGADQVDNWVAHPRDATHNGSNHERGEAADIFGDQDWLAANAPKFGLVQPMSWESWHWEPAGLRGQSTPQAYTKGPPGTLNPTVDPTLDSSPSELMAHTTTLFGAPITNLGSSFPTGGESGLPGPSTDAGGMGSPSGAAGQQAMLTSVGGGGGQLDGTAASSGPAVNVSYTGGDAGGTTADPNVRTAWTVGFLKAIGAPVTPENVGAVLGWAVMESGGWTPNAAGGRNNPLNIVRQKNDNAIGQGGAQGDIADFGDIDSSVKATARLFLGNGNAAGIISGLRSNAGVGIVSSVNSFYGSWGGGASFGSVPVGQPQIDAASSLWSTPAVTPPTTAPPPTRPAPPPPARPTSGGRGSKRHV